MMVFGLLTLLILLPRFTSGDVSPAPCNHSAGYEEGVEEGAEFRGYGPEAYFNLTLERCDPLVLAIRANATRRHGIHPTVGLGSVVGIFVGVGIVAGLVAFGFHMVRKYVYHDSDSLDTSFDAGGKVSIGMTATTIVSQWTWSATLLQSSTVASKYGISGPFWYAAGATIHLLLFSVLSIQLKTRAPGAKTFLQVIKARFGSATHITFCVLAGFTNLVVTASLILAGCAVLNSLVIGLHPVLSVVLFAVVIGGYTLIGGLGATFYVSYFNSAVIFIVILLVTTRVYCNESASNILGSSDNLFLYLQCTLSPKGNSGRSYLTFLSQGGLFFGITNVIGNFGTVFSDQSYWQSSVAAKPLQGVWGFISGGLTWFAIPFSLATTMGLTYLALSSAQGQPLLSPEDVNKGMVAPVVAQSLLGTTGEYAMIFLILMAVMSTGSAEIIAVVSVIIYDIFQCYIQPFREKRKEDECILCGRPTRFVYLKTGGPICQCPNARKCLQCKNDDQVRKECKKLVKPSYKCATHGEYKEYLESLAAYKSWGIVWTTLFIIPLFLACNWMNLNLEWVYLFTGVIISAGVFPIAMSIMWARLNSKGMMAGAIGGGLCGLISWLVVASTYPGGLTNFLENTGQGFTMLIGNVVSLLSGALICVFVTLITSKPMSPADVESEWEKTRNIDNPLNPWTMVYQTDLKIGMNTAGNERPSLELVMETFRRPRIIAYSFGGVLALVLVVIWPGIMASFDIFNIAVFYAWTTIARVWTYLATAFIIAVPLAQEVISIVKRIRLNKLEEEGQVKAPKEHL